MIKPLRKKHLEIWIALALLLPAAMLRAWLAQPIAPISSSQKQEAAAFELVTDSFKSSRYIARIRYTQNHASCQLEYINQLPLEVPSILLYRVNNGAATIDGNQLLGRIGQTGPYYFPLPQAREKENFILYDFIHQQVIDTIKF